MARTFGERTENARDVQQKYASFIPCSWNRSLAESMMLMMIGKEK
jgi:hypothetical protein